jgi:hypothetical protein
MKGQKIILPALFILMSFSVPAGAIQIHLSEAQRGEAISYGVRNLNTDTRVFFKEWTVDHGVNGLAILNSEFLTLANSARDAALDGQEMDPYAIEDSLAKTQGKLVFTIYAYGKTEDFAKDYGALLKTNGKTYPATYWEDGEVTPSESHPGMLVQELFYYFPVGSISPESQIILQIGTPAQKDKIQFEFDLKKIR